MTTNTPRSGKDALGRFTTGNRFWEASPLKGAARIYTDPEVLRADCIRYFEWVDENPLLAAEVVAFKGDANIIQVPRVRAMTIGGLNLFLGISTLTWDNWRKDRPDLQEVVAWAEAVIREQKFTAAAAGFLNPGLVARDLGLADKSEVTSKTTVVQISGPEADL